MLITVRPIWVKFLNNSFFRRSKLKRLKNIIRSETKNMFKKNLNGISLLHNRYRLKITQETSVYPK